MLPLDFKQKMAGLLSGSEYDEFIESFERDEENVRALRINKEKCERSEAVIHNAIGVDAEGVPWEERGFYYSDDKTPGKHPYHEAGLYYIQEPSAMAPVHFLDPKPGERVLDLCAAPGGKTTQIADRMKGMGILVTNEINRDRAKILSQNVERLGVKNAMVLNEDSGHLSEVFEGYFEKILVDAPCSGEGMFRKNDNAESEWSLENVLLCAKRQEEILDNAAKMLVPGGRLVYSTCTFSPEENEENIYKFLLRHVDFHVESVSLCGGMENGREKFVDEQKCQEELSSSDLVVGDKKKYEDALEQTGRSVRLWPHRVRGEGHFLCVLKRDGVLTEGASKYIPGGRNVSAKKDSCKVFSDFAGDTFAISDEKGFSDILRGDVNLELKGGTILSGRIISFGDQLYLSPAMMPSVTGLKVLRPGLHLGTVKKDRFEPSHALALALKPEDVSVYADFPFDTDEIKQYLNGQTLRPSKETVSFDKKEAKGWCIISTDGYSIGWGKIAGGVLKNHYPKGLRINY
ncbi:MAG: RsmB/NOP family class I SAM-dependent RNA methyltransferase [Butyrivibrio sp.]|nr:RsmB/NOP family class I SAM-dependent RNA methyltransferase [Butyrivibrio sp.]